METFENTRNNSINRDEDIRGPRGISDEEVKLIQKVITPPQKPLTIRHIQIEVERLTGNVHSKHALRSLIKSRLGYSYKKGSSKVQKDVTSKSLAVKRVFAAEILKAFNDEKLVINIDESSFDRSLKQLYSWLPRNGGGPVVTANPTGK